ncbi:MAG: class I SAM-dependent methyltransferase [Actinomycetota bacterium]|nr:class I SAM-dependent methyltransferase [Actinomycetota bacterium]
MEARVGTGSALRPALRSAQAALKGRLPAHYAGSWRDAFDSAVQRALRPGLRILDVGAGKSPALAPEKRPEGCRYVGLDLSRAQLEQAPVGSYDDWVVADATDWVPGLADSFDLVLSFQVLEHVKPLAGAMENLRRYLVPGGRLVAQLSGTFSVFGIANRLIPPGASMWLLERLLHRPRETVFPAYYDHCWSSALLDMLSEWSSTKVTPIWWGANYFQFSAPLKAGYLVYEEWTRLAGYRNLAPYYVVEAAR